jgi:hypothetical protein
VSHKTRAVLLHQLGLVHRVLVQGDGSDGTGCGQNLYNVPRVPVRPVQVIVYHLEQCQLPGCWEPGRWKRFLEGTA